LSPKKSFVINLIINTFSTNIIAPSKAVYRYLVEVEKVSPKKLHLINYGYNFDMYKVDKIGIASEIRQKYQCKMLILSVCRLISVKRHNLMLEVVESLLKKGLDVKWICLGTGDLLQHYQRLVKEKGLSDRIYFLGFQKNVADFMEAADVFLHLSETEASNSAVKEAGLEKLAVIVCEKVGDFEDYIETGKNGFLVNKENPVPEAISCLEELYQNPDKTKTIGENLYRKVLEEFSIEKVKPKYEELLKKVI
ncbi:MAG: glycosyltransferase family 4 protein, partial [Deltaproteobacteria bacterium]|nr:glycosyltransferase family 4 protein [Deltaproteobacteria bacterium]